MRVTGRGKETYLYINGLSVNREVRLADHVRLLPAHCSANPVLITTLLKNNIDVGVAILFLSDVTSQLQIVGEPGEELARLAWNFAWDALLLSALFHCDAICNFQSDSKAESLDHTSSLHVTNYHLRGLSVEDPRVISDGEADWIEKHFENARNLLSNISFENAVHALASYNWHSLARAQLALLWSGIEGLFEVDSELVFRVSLYAARFLEPENEINRKQTFEDVKRLSIVHKLFMVLQLKTIPTHV